MQPSLFMGAKSIPLNELPEEAWSIIQGTHDKDDPYIYRRAVGVLYRCIQIRANAVRRLPWRVLDDKEQEVFVSTEQKLPTALPWLRRIKPLLGLTEASLILTSQAFWYKNLSVGGKIIDLQWLSPTSVKPVWSQEDGLTGFRRTLQKGKPSQSLPLEQVVYAWILDPLHETKPDTPALKAVSTAAGVLFDTDEFVSGYFRRGAIKATLLTVEGEMAKTEKTRLKEWWRRFFSGVANAGNAEVIQSNVKPVVVGEGLAELSNKDLTAERREEIATALGVPHSMVFSNAANYATAAQDKRNFYDETVLPSAVDIIALALNDQLFAPLGLQFEFLPESLEIYQEDEAQRSEAYRNYVGSGMRPSVAAEVLGIDLPHNVQYKDLDIPAETAQPTPTRSEPDEESVAKSLRHFRELDIDKWRRKALKRLETKDLAACDFESEFLSPLECAAIRENLTLATSRGEVAQAFERVVKEGGDGQHFFTLPTPWAGATIPDARASVAAFKAMILQLDPDDDEAEQKARMGIEQKAVDDLEKAFKEQQKGLLSEAPTSVSAVESRVVDTSLPVREALRRALVAGTDLGVTAALTQLEQIGFSFDWLLVNTQAREWAHQHAATLVQEINETTRQRIRQAVAEWIESGEPLSALVKTLSPTFGRQRAEMIAATEITRAYAKANRESYLASGIVGKVRWYAAMDERVCPICGSLHGQEVDVDKEFSVGMPPAHPRCRCWIVPVVDRKLIRQQVTG